MNDKWAFCGSANLEKRGNPLFDERDAQLYMISTTHRSDCRAGQCERKTCRLRLIIPLGVEGGLGFVYSTAKCRITRELVVEGRIFAGSMVR